MAFENVFGNVDFGLPVRAANADRQHFAQMLGLGLQQAQFQQQMDMKKRQMEQSGVDVSKVAENALLKRNMGMPLDAKEEAAIATMGQTQRPQIYTDPLTQQTVVRPSPWSGLSAGTQEIPQAMPQPMSQPMPQGGIAPVSGNPGMMLPGAGEPVEAVDDLGVAPMPPPPDNEMQPYEAPEFLGNKGRLMQEESKRKLQETFEIEKIKRKIKGPERFNESQLQAANFANRMVKTREILDDLPKSAKEAKTGKAGFFEAVVSAIPSMGLTDKLGKGVVKISATPDQQKYLNAATNWIRANLRKESGAVIGEQEMIDEYSTYFPTAGDSPEVIKQKMELRKAAEDGMVTMAAGAYEEAFPGQKTTTSQRPQITPEQARAELERRRAGQ